MVTPELRISIICSKVNPACSPSLASLRTFSEGDAILFDPGVKVSWPERPVCDSGHGVLESASHTLIQNRA